LLVNNWVNYTPNGLDEEIKSVIWRNMVEEKYFKFGIIENLNEDATYRLINENHYKDKGEFKMSAFKK
jgi:hypothetical protein